MALKHLRFRVAFLAVLMNASCGSHVESTTQVASAAESFATKQKIGVVLVVHGGFDRYTDQNVWDNSVQMFSYDPNSPVYKYVIWNPNAWPSLLTANPESLKNAKKYRYEYEKVGGTDPFQSIVQRQTADLSAELARLGTEQNVEFLVQRAQWIADAENIASLPFPRYVYTSPANPSLKCNYCGEKESAGPWPNCDPERYNLDGPFERLASRGASRIYMVDMTVGGVRFSKTFDVYRMAQKALSAWGQQHGKTIPLTWINDPDDLMQHSYPTEPSGWTASLGLPIKDVSLALSSHPNPIASDPELASINSDGIDAGFCRTTADSKTGIILLNHPIVSNNEVFDPKIDDTVVLNKNIEIEVLARHPALSPDHVIGAWMGVHETNTENGFVEPTRDMRGENLGAAYLYETTKVLPGGKWGFRYWDALRYLMNQGVEHIVVGFPQIVADSVLNQIEVQNQIAKEIGYKGWRPSHTTNIPFLNDSPFAAYWGIWAETECNRGLCCFVMGGCPDGRSYPPQRQTPMGSKMSEGDPSLVFEVSAFGHLGYSQSDGPPDASKPVQGQYRGTWSMYRVASESPRLVSLLAKHVLSAVRDRL